VKKDVSHTEQDVDEFLVDENCHFFFSFLEIASTFGCGRTTEAPFDAWDDSVCY
jgi:hypothetical protein